MRVVVCIKPIKSHLVYANENRNEAYVMNPYDLYAITNIIALKESANLEIIAVCMGPKESECILKKALAMGANQAILLSDASFIGSDTVATSYILSKAIKKIGDADIIVFGKKSIDGETGQVVFGVSELLSYECFPAIEKIVSIESAKLVVLRKRKGLVEKVKLPVPIVVSYDDFIVKQPVINLLALKRTKNKEVLLWNVIDIDADIQKCGNAGSKTKVIQIKEDIVKKDHKVFDGTTEENTRAIINLFRTKGGGCD